MHGRDPNDQHFMSEVDTFIVGEGGVTRKTQEKKTQDNAILDENDICLSSPAQGLQTTQAKTHSKKKKTSDPQRPVKCQIFSHAVTAVSPTQLDSLWWTAAERSPKKYIWNVDCTMEQCHITVHGLAKTRLVLHCIQTWLEWQSIANLLKEYTVSVATLVYVLFDRNSNQDAHEVTCTELKWDKWNKQTNNEKKTMGWSHWTDWWHICPMHMYMKSCMLQLETSMYKTNYRERIYLEIF